VYHCISVNSFAYCTVQRTIRKRYENNYKNSLMIARVVCRRNMLENWQRVNNILSACNWIYKLINSGVVKSPSNSVARGAPNIQNTEVCFRFFRTGFRSSDRRQYPESRL